ncbi:MAG: dTMP kinase [Myxococcales bacterium]|nr:dTMP kinase [Myxococcales bacterium]
MTTPSPAPQRGTTRLRTRRRRAARQEAPFIVLEGIDGAGTTTQLARLADHLESEGRPVHRTFEPSTGPIGRLVRSYLKNELTTAPGALALLFAADRLDHVSREIEPALASGKIVLSDRYVGSSLAYQSLASSPAWLRSLNRHARRPDLVLYLRVDADTALARIERRDGDRRELFEQRETLARVVDAYDGLYCGTDPELPAVVIDGNRLPEAVFADIDFAVRSVLSA